MSEFELNYTGQFKKDLKSYKHDTEKIADLEKVLRNLRKKGKVPNKYKPHQLVGNYQGFLECHIQNDFLLIWVDKYSPNIKLIRIGSHSKLFGR